MKVFAVDPGMHTGVAWGNVVDGVVSGFDSRTFVCRGEKALGTFQGEYGMCGSICEMVGELGVEQLVVEDFILRVGPGVRQSSDRSGLSAVRVTAVMLTVLMEWGYEELVSGCVFQGASVQSLATSDRLRSAGMWKRGASDHERSAAKHLWAYMRR